MDAAAAVLLGKLAESWPAERWRDVTVLVAVSGGADSVALARGLAELRSHAIPNARHTHPNPLPEGDGKIVLAHFNHRLRGAESDADEAFVRDLAVRLDLQVAVGSAEHDLAAEGSGEGIEGAARQARYEFLERVAGQCGARYIATAHTADDQAETVLLNVLRGTGLAGLAGIPRVRRLGSASIVRPLLEVARGEVVDYLASIQQPFRDDSSNRLEDFTRNRLRLKLLPQLEAEYNPRVREALSRIGQIAEQAKGLIESLAKDVLEVATKRIDAGAEIDVTKLTGIHPAVIRQALWMIWDEQGWPLQDMSHDKWQRLVEWCVGTASATQRVEVFPGGIRATLGGNKLRLTLPPS